MNQPIKQSVHKSINPTINQSNNQSMNQPIKQSVHKSIYPTINEWMNQCMNESMNQPINKIHCFQSIIQPIYPSIQQSINQSSKQCMNEWINQSIKFMVLNISINQSPKVEILRRRRHQFGLLKGPGFKQLIIQWTENLWYTTVFAPNKVILFLSSCLHQKKLQIFSNNFCGFFLKNSF